MFVPTSGSISLRLCQFLSCLRSGLLSQEGHTFIFAQGPCSSTDRWARPSTQRHKKTTKRCEVRALVSNCAFSLRRTCVTAKGLGPARLRAPSPRENCLCQKWKKLNCDTFASDARGFRVAARVAPSCCATTAAGDLCRAYELLRPWIEKLAIIPPQTHLPLQRAQSMRVSRTPWRPGRNFHECSNLVVSSNYRCKGPRALFLRSYTQESDFGNFYMAMCVSIRGACQRPRTQLAMRHNDACPLASWSKDDKKIGPEEEWKRIVHN